MKKKYIIAFNGLFENGYVILKTFEFKGKTRGYNSIYEAKKDATHFRFKFMADFTCWLLNKSTPNVLRTFKVIICDIPTENDGFSPGSPLGLS